MSLIELNPYGRCTVNIATMRITIIGMLTTRTKTPSITAPPPSSSTRIVSQAIAWGIGTPIA
jgi:hypothetical protein